MKRWTEAWSSFPTAHKKRCYQGVAGYGILMLLCTAWISFHARTTLESWKSSIPSATASVKNVFPTPQITDNATGVMPQQSGNPTPPPVVDNGKIYVSVIVSNLGLSSLATERAIDDLPPQITLAFSPYADNVQQWIKKAVNANHEALMLAPMESADYPKDDPGPRALSSRQSNESNDTILKWLLTHSDGAIGVMNMMGSRYLTDSQKLENTFMTLRDNDTMFVETPDIKNSAAQAAATKTGLPFMEANLRIDGTPTDSAIQGQLENLVIAARKYGYAIGIAQPYPLTLNILKSWAANLSSQGVILAPLKTIWRNKKHYLPATPSPVQADEAISKTSDLPQPPPQSQLKQP